MNFKKTSNKNEEFKMTKEGSLGLLAFGDIGLREWRKFKNQTLQRKDGKEEK